jgi:hypothetical protein
MPVILDETGAADWMNLREPGPLSLKRLLVPAPDDLLVVRPASPLVNSVKNEGSETPGGSVVIWPIAGARMPFPPLPCQIAGDGGETGNFGSAT